MVSGPSISSGRRARQPKHEDALIVGRRDRTGLGLRCPSAPPSQPAQRLVEAAQLGLEAADLVPVDVGGLREPAHDRAADPLALVRRRPSRPRPRRRSEGTAARRVAASESWSRRDRPPRRRGARSRGDHRAAGRRTARLKSTPCAHEQSSTIATRSAGLRSAVRAVDDPECLRGRRHRTSRGSLWPLHALPSPSSRRPVLTSYAQAVGTRASRLACRSDSLHQ